MLLCEGPPTTPKVSRLSSKQCDHRLYPTTPTRTYKFPSRSELPMKQNQDSNLPTMDHTQSQTMELSPLDQIMVRGIVRLILCFPVRDHSHRSLIIQTLQKGIDETVKQMPYLSGSIRERENARREIEVVYKHGDTVQLLVKDLGGKLPTYQELRRKQMPPSYFKDDLFSPLRNMPDAGRKLHPVMVMQASFVQGGVFLCACFHHSVLDGSGFAFLLNVLGKNCANVREPELQRVGEDSLERGGLFQNLHDVPDCKSDGFPEYFLKDPNSLVPPEAGGDEHPTTARLFHVRKSALQKLKESALPEGGHRWISTLDALNALAWSCVTRARFPRYNSQAESRFCIFVNCRRRIHGYVPKDFIGNVCVGAQAKLTSAEVVNSRLSVLAEHIRQSITSVNKEYVLGLVKHVKEYSGDLNCIKPGIQSYMGNDINLVSWVTFNVYEMDFGPYLGKPEWFRCPWRTLDGTVKILPERKTPRPGSTEAGFEVNVELREDDMKRLLQDPKWISFTEEVLY